MELIRIKVGQMEPMPQEEDVVEVTETFGGVEKGIYKLGRCTCGGSWLQDQNGDPAWPDSCGPHMYDRNGREIGQLAYNTLFGWNFTGFIIGRKAQNDSGLRFTAEVIKALNTKPTSTNCCKCNAKLKNPFNSVRMPEYNHCPKCEP